MTEPYGEASSGSGARADPYGVPPGLEPEPKVETAGTTNGDPRPAPSAAADRTTWGCPRSEAAPMPGPTLADRRIRVRPTRPRPADRRAAPRTSYAPPHQCGRASFARTRPLGDHPPRVVPATQAWPCWGAEESPGSHSDRPCRVGNQCPTVPGVRDGENPGVRHRGNATRGVRPVADTKQPARMMRAGRLVSALPRRADAGRGRRSRRAWPGSERPAWRGRWRGAGG